MEGIKTGLNLVTLKDGREADRLEENLDRIAAAGFDGVGLWTTLIAQWLTAGRTVEQMVDAVNQRGLEVHEICFVSVMDGEGGVVDAAEAFGWAQALSAGAMICIYNNHQASLDVNRTQWAEFVGKIESFGVPAAFEFIGAWPRLKDPQEAWQVIAPGPELGTIVFDTFHFWRGGGELSQIAEIPPERISLVHLNDVNDVPAAEATDKDRTYPGEGAMGVDETLRALLDHGFAGPLSVEIFGPIQEIDPDEACRRAYQSTQALLARL